MLPPAAPLGEGRSEGRKLTRPEWIEVVQLIRLNWPHATVPDGSITKWYADLEHLPAEQVRVAVETLYRDGREYPPNSGHILAKLADLDHDAVGYGEGWALAKRAALKAPKASAEWLAERDPIAAATVRQLCGGPVLTFMLDDEPTVRAQFRNVYQSLESAQKRDAAYSGLPSAGLRRLERGPRKLGDALRRALPEGAK